MLFLVSTEASDFIFRYNPQAMKMISTPSDIAVDLETCLANKCHDDCSKIECELCLNCLEDRNLEDFHESYRETTRRGAYKRVFPSEKFTGEEYIEGLTTRSEKVLKWFNAKCRNDEKFC
jgi:hypothetical protein